MLWMRQDLFGAITLTVLKGWKGEGEEEIAWQPSMFP